MSTDSRHDQWRLETEGLYARIGEFVVKFERVCFSMALGVTAILGRSGLKDQQIAGVLLAGVTAEPLRPLFESLVAQTDWLDSKDCELLKSLMGRVQKLTAERNDIVHGTWLIDFHTYAADQQDFSRAFGMKQHKNKDGIATKSFEKTTDDFQRLIDEADQLRSSLDKLCARFIFDESGRQVALLPPFGAGRDAQPSSRADEYRRAGSRR